MNELPSWGEVGNAARELGSSDFYDALREVPNREKDRFWDEMTSAGLPKGKVVQGLERADDERRRAFIAAQLRGWREEPDERHLLAAGAMIRAALASRPPEAAEIVRPAFGEGNLAAVSSGSRSRRLIAEELPREVERVTSVLLEDAPEDLPPGSGLLIEHLARLSLVARRQAEHLERVGPMDVRGQPRKITADYRATVRSMGDVLHALGQTPRSQAKILADRAQGARDVVAGRRAALDVEEELRRRYGA